MGGRAELRGHLELRLPSQPPPTTVRPRPRPAPPGMGVGWGGGPAYVAHAALLPASLFAPSLLLPRPAPPCPRPACLRSVTGPPGAEAGRLQVTALQPRSLACNEGLWGLLAFSGPASSAAGICHLLHWAHLSEGPGPTPHTLQGASLLPTQEPRGTTEAERGS